jgi:hypothetical protein
MARADRTSFVGRTGLLEALAGLLDDVATGAGWAAVVYGEAGIGKTRTVEEVARLAGRRGLLVAWGHCTELDGVPPFWPWREVFRALDGGPRHGARDPGRALVSLTGPEQCSRPAGCIAA